MKPIIFLALILVGCVTSPTKDSTPSLKVGMYHDIVANDVKLEIKQDRSTYYFQLQADSSKIPLGYGSVFFSGDTIKISPCYKCDTASYFAHGDTLLVVKSGDRATPFDPPRPSFVKE